MNEKRLCKSNDRRLCGVCAGVAKYLGVDPTLIRLVWLLVALCYGTGVLLYIIMAIVMPEES